MFNFMTKLCAQTISHGLMDSALMREYCQDPTKWCLYLQDALAHIISSCKYLSGLNSGSLRSFPCQSFNHHSETSYVITLVHYYQSHFETWSRQKNVSLSFLVLLLFSFIDLVIVVLYVSSSLNINQLLPRVSSLHFLYPYPSLNLQIPKWRHFALWVGTAYKLKLKPCIQI